MSNLVVTRHLSSVSDTSLYGLRVTIHHSDRSTFKNHCLTGCRAICQLLCMSNIGGRYDEATGTNGVPAYTGACRITDDGESRDNFDDVDDYNVVVNEAPDTMDASLATDYSGYTVSISVVCDDSIGVNTGGTKRIQISINDPTGDTSVFSVYKGNY